jgi:Protein of unknown function (DUF4238)
MTEKKRHHYVPQTYLQNFSFKKSKDIFQLHWLPVGILKENKISSSNIKNLCVVSKLYTLPGNTVEGKMLIEDFYNDAYERGYQSVYKKMTDEAVTDITDEDRRLIIGMAVSLFYRNPFWLNSHTDFIGDMFSRAFELSKANGHDSFYWDNEEISIKGKTVDDLKREYREEARPNLIIEQVQAAINLLKLRINSDGINITRIKNPAFEFLTSDRPVNIINPDKGHIIPMDPLNFLTMPIDSKHQLSLLPQCHPGNKYKILRDSTDGFIDSFTHNAQQAMAADKFLFGSEQGLKSFVKLMEKVEANK